MKKIFFFLCFFFFLFTEASAESIKNLEVINGTLSREFESTNNVYSVILNEDATSLEVNYELIDPEAKVTIENKEYQENGENKAEIKIENTDGTKESYVFYLEKEETTPVFSEVNLNQNIDTQKEIPGLIVYVSLGCFLLIACSFKILVLGFKKRK